MRILPADFFAQSSVDVARALIGQWLVHEPRRGRRLIGRIVETEAYREDDPACHAWSQWRRKRLREPTGRSAALFGAPGTAYVYLNYGVHWLLNVVTEPEGVAGAVLFRAVEPIEGIEAMRRRRGALADDVRLTNGPGKLTQAFGIDQRHHGTPLTDRPLYFAESDGPTATVIASAPRIGIRVGTELPWRFLEPENPYVSKPAPADAHAR